MIFSENRCPLFGIMLSDARHSSEVTRVQIPQIGPFQLFPLRLTAGCRTLNARIVVRIHEGEPILGPPAGDRAPAYTLELTHVAVARDSFAYLRLVRSRTRL